MPNLPLKEIKSKFKFGFEEEDSNLSIEHVALSPKILNEKVYFSFGFDRLRKIFREFSGWD